MAPANMEAIGGNFDHFAPATPGGMDLGTMEPGSGQRNPHAAMNAQTGEGNSRAWGDLLRGLQQPPEPQPSEPQPPGPS
jgi:hypothetical protein